ncbi:MAG: hypothetical protein U9R74_12070 [Pseudomonadota bacterium]|nr:hypothetical protein [Pseudomonadota bacterium]
MKMMISAVLCVFSVSIVHASSDFNEGDYHRKQAREGKKLYQIWVDPNEVHGVPDLAIKSDDKWQALIEVKNCSVQNDGSTFCDYYVDGSFAVHGCYSDWDGGICNGDETED